MNRPLYYPVIWSLRSFNIKFKSIKPGQRIIELYKIFKPDKEEIMLTSSFKYYFNA